MNHKNPIFHDPMGIPLPVGMVNPQEKAPS